MVHYVRALAILSVLSLSSGCATWARNGVEEGADGRYGIAMPPVLVTADVDNAKQIMSGTISSHDEKSAIQRSMRDMQVRLTKYVRYRLADTKHLRIVPINTSEFPSAPDAQGVYHFSPEQLDLYRKANVQAVLQVKLAGYGKLKKQWVTLLIGSGVVEGLVQGVAAAKLLNNTTAGLAVGLEEISQEVLTWGGGSYLFDSYFSPVTLRADLISVKNGKLIWSDTVFESANKDGLAYYPKAQREDRALQLWVTTEKGVEELKSELSDVVQDNDKSESKSVR